MSDTPRRKKVILIIIGLVAAYGLYQFFTRASTPEEVIVRSVIEAQAESVEASHANDFLERIHPQYSDNMGNASKEEFGSYIKLLFGAQMGKRKQVSVTSCDITMGQAADEAQAVIEVAAWSMGKKKIKTAADAIPSGAERYRFTLDMKQHDGEWKIVRAVRDKTFK